MALAHNLSIGTLAKRTYTSTSTIRYYEAIGLLRRSNRGAGGQRIYGEVDVRRLTFIRRCRNLGFPLAQVQTLIALMEDGDRSCLEVRELAQKHLAALRVKLAELEALQKGVADFARDCDTKCSGVSGAECEVLRDLSHPFAMRAVELRKVSRGDHG